MKKVLSLVLAVMMVVGMSVTAFAAITDGATAATAGTASYSGYAAPGQTVKLPVTVTTPAAGTATGSETLTNPQAGVASATLSMSGATGELTIKVASNAVVGTDTIAGSYVFTTSGGTLTIAVTAANPIVYTTVPSTWRIKEFSDDDNATWNPAASIGIGEEKDELVITAAMFNWEAKGSDGKYTDADTTLIAPSALLRSSHLSNVGVRRVYQKGTSGTIKSVDLKDSKSLVEVKTVKYYAKTSSTDIELKLALTFKSKTSNVVIANYTFSMANAEESIEEGQNQAYSYGNVFQKAEATVRDVEFEGDEDGIVYATKTVVKGQKYYFNVDSELTDEDSKIIADNPEVDSIYNVYQVNMANATVKFKDLDREYFVYDASGKLLGTTKDSKLPLASKYILTTAKVNFAGESDVEETPAEEEPAPTEPEAPPMGGGEVVETPANNYNPNTGR